MKKRIKLTDGELAIGMWAYLYLNISKVTGDTGGSRISSWKLGYLRAHNLEKGYWLHSCLLCQRYNDGWGRCESECPLSEDGKNCCEGSIYESVLDYHRGGKYAKNATEACKKIMNIMIEEARRYEVEDSEERE